MKNLIIIAFFLVGQSRSFGQLPSIKHNYSTLDSSGNPLIDSFAMQYDFTVAYTEQSYWWSDRKSYKILACSDNQWTSWTYSDYTIQWTKKKGSKKILVDTVRYGQFTKGKTDLKNSSVLHLFSALDSNYFWELNNGSLNETVVKTWVENGDTVVRKASVSDGVNYRFDILTKESLRVIESYEPDYFLKLSADMEERKKFVKSRDAFLKWWELYCN